MRKINAGYPPASAPPSIRRVEGARTHPSGGPAELLGCPPMTGPREDIMSVGGGVQRIEITDRETPVFGGAEFGAVGTYERLHGIVFGELDPTHRLNAGIVNLDRAARNARGNVEYQSDFRILKPLDLERGNGCLVYDVPNRGNQPVMPAAQRRARRWAPPARRQRLPDAPRLHAGVERLAG